LREADILYTLNTDQWFWWSRSYSSQNWRSSFLSIFIVDAGFASMECLMKQGLAPKEMFFPLDRRMNSKCKAHPSQSNRLRCLKTPEATCTQEMSWDMCSYWLLKSFYNIANCCKNVWVVYKIQNVARISRE